MKPRRASILLLSPPAILLFVWLLTALGAYLGAMMIDRMPFLSRTMRDHGLDFDYPLAGIVWVTISMLVFLVLSTPMLRLGPPEGPPRGSSGSLSNAIRVAALVLALFAFIIIFWILTTAAQLGGIGTLITMMQSFEAFEAREALLGNKLFVGMRLLYAGFFSLGVFGVCVIAYNVRTGDRIRSDMILGGLISVTAMVLLAILSVILLKRIIAIQTIIGAFVGSSIIMGRIVGWRYAPIAIFILFSIWSAKEALTVGEWNPDANPFMIGFERLLFYFANDFGNSVWPFSIDTPHTYGYFTFRFLVFFSLQDEYFGQLLSNEMRELAQVRGGGEFPLFTGPYIDFSHFGIVVVAFIAVLFTFIFNMAQTRFVYGWLYGMIGAGLFVATHVPYYSSHDFFFNVMIALFISAFIKRDRRVHRRSKAAHEQSDRSTPHS